MIKWFPSRIARIIHNINVRKVLIFIPHVIVKVKLSLTWVKAMLYKLANTLDTICSYQRSNIVEKIKTKTIYSNLLSSLVNAWHTFSCKHGVRKYN